MIRFDGNTILIADSDDSYVSRLSAVLSEHGATCFTAADIEESKKCFRQHDFDLVIANYYLSDGIIHQLIDWCSSNLKMQPIFTCTSYPLSNDVSLCHKQSIACTFSKTDTGSLLTALPHLLFDLNEYHERLLEIVSPEEIKLSICIGEKDYLVSAIEVTDESIHVDIQDMIKNGTFGILTFSLDVENEIHNFKIPGSFTNKCADGMIFTVNKNYVSSWEQFLKFLSMKQMNISDFLNKAAGY
jgi:CheY-like chemotaxis protein